MKEADIQRACLEWLAAKGIFAWRNNNTGVYDPRTGRWRFHGMHGVSDILGVLSDGRLLAIEVKQPGKHPTEAQDAFLDRVAENGGVAMAVHSVDELEADLLSLGV